MMILILMIIIMITTAGGITLVELKIQRGTFKRDALSPLLFINAMMPIKHILRNAYPDKNLVDRRKWMTSNYL